MMRLLPSREEYSRAMRAMTLRCYGIYLSQWECSSRSPVSWAWSPARPALFGNGTGGTDYVYKGAVGQRANAYRAGGWIVLTACVNAASVDEVPRVLG